MPAVIIVLLKFTGPKRRKKKKIGMGGEWKPGFIGIILMKCH